MQGSAGINFINVLGTRFLYEILVPKISKPNVTREKLLNLLSYEKRACKMLMKLTPGFQVTRLREERENELRKNMQMIK